MSAINHSTVRGTERAREREIGPSEGCGGGLLRQKERNRKRKNAGNDGGGGEREKLV